MRDEESDHNWEILIDKGSGQQNIFGSDWTIWTTFLIKVKAWCYLLNIEYKVRASAGKSQLIKGLNIKQVCASSSAIVEYIFQIWFAIKVAWSLSAEPGFSFSETFPGLLKEGEVARQKFCPTKWQSKNVPQSTPGNLKVGKSKTWNKYIFSTECLFCKTIGYFWQQVTIGHCNRRMN